MSIYLSSQSISPSGSMTFGLKSSISATFVKTMWSAGNHEEREYPFLFSFPRAPRAPRGLNGCSQSFVNELLDAFSFVGLACIDITLRIYGDAANGVELARHASARAEARDDFERVAPQDEDLFVVAVGDVEEALLRVVRERDVPHRSVAESRFRDESLFHEFAVFLKHLDPVILAVADIDQTILRDCGAVHCAKLFCRGGIRIISPETGVIGFLAVSAPVSLVRAGVGVEDDDAVIAGSIGYVDLVSRRINSDAGRPVQSRFAITALDLARASDL